MPETELSFFPKYRVCKQPEFYGNVQYRVILRVWI